MSDREAFWKRTLDRERSARKQAEGILEQKSLVLYEVNTKLKAAHDELEQRVEERTRELEEANRRLRLEIVERERASAQLEKAIVSAQKASRAKSEFLAGMSHEIRTPLSGIVGMAELTLDTDLNAEQTEYLTILRGSADVLLRVINDILDFSKIEAGKLDLTPIAFDLRDRIDGVLKGLALSAHRKGLELTAKVEPEVPRRILGDPGRLGQILINLLNNAIKFTDEGEVILTVDSEGPLQAGNVVLRFRVSDTGIGIAESRHNAIFEPFVQADNSSTRVHGGTGLGLTIAQRLVELMHGRLSMQSTLGEGSTFEFTASFQEAEVGTGVFTLPLIPKDARVLLAVEHRATRESLFEMLNSKGMTVTGVATARQAFEAMSDSSSAGIPFPLTIVEAEMSEHDCFWLAEELVKHPEVKGSVIPLLRTSNLIADIAACQACGFQGHLTKPVSRAELRTLIRKVFGMPQPTTSPALKPSQTASRPLKVLLAEDGVVNQRLAVRLLEKRGHTVVVAGDGQATLRAWRNGGDFDIILMDLQMPVLDGFDTLAAIRLESTQGKKYTPIIALTAHNMKGDRELCLRSGFDDFVAKPIETAELFGAIERLVVQSSASSTADQQTKQNL